MLYQSIDIKRLDDSIMYQFTGVCTSKSYLLFNKVELSPVVHEAPCLDVASLSFPYQANPLHSWMCYAPPANRH